jgi:CHAT domain-containing protein
MRLLSFLTLFLIGITHLWAQSNPKEIYDQAQELSRKGQYKEANQLYLQAAHLYCSNPNQPAAQCDAGWYIKSRLEVARNISASGEHGLALDSLNQLLPIAKRLLGADAPIVARIQNSIAQVYERMGNYQQALLLYRQTLYIYKANSGDKNINVAYLYNNIGISFDNLAQYDSAFFYKKKSLDLQIELNNGNDRTQDIGELYNAIGVTYDNMGDYDNAISYYNKALSILTGILNERDPILADTYDNLGVAYEKINDNTNALRFKAKALSIREGKPSVALARSYVNLGQQASKDRKYAEAKAYYDKAVEVFYKFGDTLGLTTAWTLIGRDYMNTNNFKEAENYFFNALKIRLEKLGAKSIETAESYTNIAELLEKRTDNQGDVFEFKDSKTGISMSATDYYQKAIQAIVIGFQANSYTKNPKIDGPDILSDEILFKALKGKAHALVAQYKYRCFNQKHKDSLCLSMMDAAFKTYKLAHELKINLLRRKNAGEYSALETIQESVSLYDDAITANVLLKVNYQKDLEEATTPEDQSRIKDQLIKLDKNIFQYSEYCKSALLIRQISLKKARSPLMDSLKVVGTQLNRKQKDLALELVKGTRGNKDKIREMQSDIFKLKQNYDELIVAIDQKSAESYKDKAADPNAIQALLKQSANDSSGKKAIIEFFLGRSTITTIYITENKFQVFNKTYDKKKLDMKVRNFRNTIIGMDYRKLAAGGYDLFNELFRQKKDTATFSESDNNPFIYDLYKTIKNDNIKELHIIPDNFLFSLPFEALITEKVRFSDADTAKDFRRLPYLIKDSISVQYAYSARLMTEKSKQRVSFTKKLLALAPVFKEEDQQLFGKKIVNPLPATEDEALKIKSLFDEKLGQTNQTTVFLNKEATLNKIIANNELSQYEVIHFATHGFVFPETPERSGILLYPDEGKDGMLYMPEIAQQNIKADLVVLSACETGLGKIENGEGIKGLTRALIQAGAGNVIVSLWSVADESTKDLMINFYRNLLKDRGFLELSANSNYSFALLKAKLRLINSKKFSAPFFWAPFVLVE